MSCSWLVPFEFITLLDDDIWMDTRVAAGIYIKYLVEGIVKMVAESYI